MTCWNKCNITDICVGFSAKVNNSFIECQLKSIFEYPLLNNSNAHSFILKSNIFLFFFFLNLGKKFLFRFPR